MANTAAKAGNPNANQSRHRNGNAPGPVGCFERRREPDLASSSASVRLVARRAGHEIQNYGEDDPAFSERVASVPGERYTRERLRDDGSRGEKEIRDDHDPCD